jgi:hypothetical protein
MVSSYKKGLNKVVVPPDCCGCCGNKRHSDRKDCPAKDNLCSLGIKGHFRKYCYRDGTKRNKQSGGDAKKTTQEKTETKEETSHGIDETCFTLSESCFSLHAKVETSTSPIKSPPIMPLPTIDLPEDVILASLQYSEGNNKWVDRAKDERSNKLHVLIKPMLEQWDKLHDVPSCTPTKSRIKKTQSAGTADTGASGTKLMRQLGLEERNLCKTTTVIRAANEAKLEVLGFITISVQVVGHQNKKSVHAPSSSSHCSSLEPASWNWDAYPGHGHTQHKKQRHAHQSQKRTLHHVAAQPDQRLPQSRQSHPSQSPTQKSAGRNSRSGCWTTTSPPHSTPAPTKYSLE